MPVPEGQRPWRGNPKFHVCAVRFVHKLSLPGLQIWTLAGVPRPAAAWSESGGFRVLRSVGAGQGLRQGPTDELDHGHRSTVTVTETALKDT